MGSGTGDPTTTVLNTLGFAIDGSCSGWLVAGAHDGVPVEVDPAPTALPTAALLNSGSQ